MEEGWSRWFLRDGRPRAFWRLVLFAALFVVILMTSVLLVPSLAARPTGADGRVAAALLTQALLTLVAALLAGWVMLRWIDRKPFPTLGFGVNRRLPLELGAGLCAGAAAIAAVVGVLTLGGAYRFASDPGTVVGWIAAMAAGLGWLALPAAAEEAVFRGYPLRTLEEGTGPAVAVLVTSALFALVHASNPGVGAFGLVNIFLAGVLLAVAVLRTGSLWFATAVHLGWNWASAALLDLPVSGLDLLDPPLYDGVPAPGAAWLTGGGFGPEGGLAGTLAAMVALTLIWWLTRPGRRLGGAAP